MNISTEPTGRPPRRSEPHTAREWLDTLAAGACDKDKFLNAMRELLLAEPDAAWEVLSLLDQYYRRGKIPSELFLDLKSRLGELAVGAEDATESSGPLIRSKVAREKPRAAPAGASTSRPALTPAPPTAKDTKPKEPKAKQPETQKKPAAKSSESNAPAAAEPETASTGVQQVRWLSGGRVVAVGDVLRGRYRLQGVLGQGSMGTVFEATDHYRAELSTVNQKLAIKVLHTAVSTRPDLLNEMRREFQDLQSLSHPNIVRVHEFDRDADMAFFTMELLNGSLLSRVLNAKSGIPLHRSASLAILRDVGSALAHAHSRGVVHGDVSPQHIFIAKDGELRILGFGASRSVRGSWISDFESEEKTPLAAAEYASCQVLEGQHPDARDDIYAFSCVAYLLLAGEHPFQKRTSLEARARRIRPRRPSGLTRTQWGTLRAGLSLDRESRPPSMREYLEGLDVLSVTHRLPTLTQLMTAPPPRPGFTKIIVLGGLIGLLLAGVVWVAMDTDSFTRTAKDLSAEAAPELARAGAFMTRAWDDARRKVGLADDAETDSIPSPKTGETSQATEATNEAPPPRAANTVGTSRSEATGVSAPTPPATQRAPISASPRAQAHSSLPALLASIASPARAVNAPPPPPARVELAKDTVEVPIDEPARIVVHRTGNLHSDVTFTWWTESGTAKPGKDFAPISEHTEHIETGKSSVTLLVPVVSDSTRRRSRNFYVVIDQAGPGASLGSRTLTMVTIPGSEPDPEPEPESN